MKTHTSFIRHFLAPKAALAAVALGLLSTVASARAAAPLTMTFDQVVALKKGRAAIFTPTRLSSGGKVSAFTITRELLVLNVAGAQRGTQIVFFAVKPDGSSVDAIADAAFPSTTQAGGGGGAGKASFSDLSFSQVPAAYVDADGKALIIPVLVGYEIPRTGAPAVPAVPPASQSISVQVDSGGIAILLPAVQKVREAAAR